MSKKTFLYNQIIEIISSKNLKEIIENLKIYFENLDIEDFTIWKITNNIAEPIYTKKEISFNLDIYDLGYNGKSINTEKIEFEFFDEVLQMYSTLFYSYNNIVFFAVSIHDSIDIKNLEMINTYHDKISFRFYEIIIKEKTTDIYVDYQKKIDFIKSGSIIFSTINIETLINTAQKFFIDAFSAEASGTIYNGEFQGIGFNFEDINEHILIKGISAYKYISSVKSTEFIDKQLVSDKFFINNIFIVYNEKNNFTFILFNISTENVPDKEFSELISSILSIALENAKNHEKMLSLKIEETEMEKTVDILNKFVPKEIKINEPIEIFGVSYPAKKTGGDYFNVNLKDDKIFICVADVCGKGYDAAVVTVVLSVINELANNERITGSMVEIERCLNEYILSKNLDGRFVTAFFGIYNLNTRELEYLSLGHEPSVLIKDNKNVLLEAEYLPIGIMQETYESKKIKIDKGDSLFIYTDGIVEYIDYTELYEYILSNINQSPDELIRNLYKELVTDADAQKDDFTCVMFKF